MPGGSRSGEALQQGGAIAQDFIPFRLKRSTGDLGSPDLPWCWKRKSLCPSSDVVGPVGYGYGYLVATSGCGPGPGNIQGKYVNIKQKRFGYTNFQADMYQFRQVSIKIQQPIPHHRDEFRTEAKSGETLHGAEKATVRGISLALGGRCRKVQNMFQASNVHRAETNLIPNHAMDLHNPTEVCCPSRFSAFTAGCRSYAGSALTTD
jgi:hypothetical protein